MPVAPLRGYQEKGVCWLVKQLAHHKAVFLGDEAGLGKTRQALSAAQRLDAERILIVCPAGARRVWAAEIARWVPGWSGRVVLYEPGTNLDLGDRPRWVSNLAPTILIVSYDALSNLKSDFSRWLQLIQWDLLVLDEAHYLKTPTSNRTKAIYGTRTNTGLQAFARRVILLSGTPTPNHAGEIWSHASTFWPWSLTGSPSGRPLTQSEFEDRFCKYKYTVFGRQITGSKRQAVLRERLREVVLRRRKAQVLPELPPLVLQDIPLDAPGGGPYLQWAESRTDDDIIRLLQGVPDAALATARRELGEMKVLPTIAWVQERLLSTNKLLLFAWHREVIARLRRGLEEFRPVVITGDTPGRERAQAIAAFQDDPKTRLFIGQIQAAGTAITLTAANEVAIVEPSWVPSDNYQAICRAHRLGQRDMVLASFLFLPETLDERIMEVFRRKAAEIAELQGDKDASHAHLRHGSANSFAHLSDAGDRAAGAAGPDADAAG